LGEGGGGVKNSISIAPLHLFLEYARDRSTKHSLAVALARVNEIGFTNKPRSVTADLRKLLRASRMSLFQALSLDNWRQFFHVELDLSKQTTVLTGTNGSGKTTILTALSRHFGWQLSFVSTPYIGKRRAKQLWSDVYEETSFDADTEIPNSKVQIGHIDYNNGKSCRLLTNRYVAANYQLDYQGMDEVYGMYIPSHRPVAVYNAVANIPTNPVEAQQHYQQYQGLLFQAFGTGSSKNPGSIQKQSLISLALFGEGNSAVAPNNGYRRAFSDFQEKLRMILPKEIGFQRIEIRMPEVVLVTDSGDFALDAMSGGINALFGIVWQIFMFGIALPEYVVIIDEPENHLHPSMQRIVLPNLAKAFPNVRFIVATHSPFIVSSFPEATIYGLFQNDEKRVVSEKLDSRDISGTPNKILREVLDIDSNLPVWVEQQIQTVINEFSQLPPKEQAREIMNKLARLGISDSLVEFRSGKASEKSN
jgi:predicted ATPase